MGKRTGQLAGLAALGALGYMLSRDSKGQAAPVETRSISPSMGKTPAAEMPAVDRGDDRDIGGGFNPASMRARAPGPASARAVAPAATSGEAATMANYVPRDRYMRSMTETDTGDVPGAAAAIARFQQDTAGMSPALAQGRAPMTKRQPTTQTYKRTGGPTAAELAAYEASRAPSRVQTSAGAGRGVYGPGGPEEGEVEEYMAQRNAGARSRLLPPITAGTNYKKGGAVKAKPAVKKMASGGMTTSKASSRADGIAQRGKTRGKIC